MPQHTTPYSLPSSRQKTGIHFQFPHRVDVAQALARSCGKGRRRWRVAMFRGEREIARLPRTGNLVIKFSDVEASRPRWTRMCTTPGKAAWSNSEQFRSSLVQYTLLTQNRLQTCTKGASVWYRLIPQARTRSSSMFLPHAIPQLKANPSE